VNASAARIEILHQGYVRPAVKEVGVTVPLVLSGDCVLVADPGMAENADAILGPLEALGFDQNRVTHVFLTHHHPDHITHVGLFPNAVLVDFRATHRGNRLEVHRGDGYVIAPGITVMHSPGHSAEDATLLVETDHGTVAYTHTWWWQDFPEIDPRGWKQSALQESRRRVLSVADSIIPCHGPAFVPPIRPCKEADFEEIYSIINDAASAYAGVIPEDRFHEPYMPREELRQQIAQGVEFWGYRKGGELLGVMGIQSVQDVVLIRHAYVRSALRQTGIGGRLLETLRSFTQRPVLIGTWADATWAIAFYQKHGFSLIDEATKVRVLRKYWGVPERQIQTSVVLADGRWSA
jgi:glyoxylase-like metal-dependent hydrolase (beta-lactamase superfamily II)